VVGAAVWTQFRHQHSLATPPVSDSMQTQKVRVVSSQSSQWNRGGQRADPVW
jgi:hypothetical protein